MKAFLKSTVAAIAAMAVAGSAPLAMAQQVIPPQVPAMTAGDLFQDIPNGFGGNTNVYASIPQIRSFVLGQGSQHLTAPTLTVTTSICGGTGATVKGTDTSGQIAEASTSSTSCVVTFATPFLTAPECFVSINNVADTALKCSTTTTALTITQTGAASNVVNYMVLGLPGG